MDQRTKRDQPGRQPAGYVDWAESIDHEVEGLSDLIWRATQDQILLAATIIGDPGTHNATRLIVNQAVNDLISLLSELAEGSGRPAMRSARTLIEHAINLHTVAEGLPQAQRYLDHLELGNALLFENQIGAELLTGRTRRDYRRALKKLGQHARRKFESAVLLYGSAFRRGWSDRTIAKRAEDHGLDNLYDLYRLGSLVAHGAAGGTLGSTKDHDDGFTTHRTGQALELAPVAMLAGLRGYLSLLDAVELVRADLDLEAYRASIVALQSIWSEYFTALKKFDDALWPDGRVAPPVAVYAYTQTGKSRWWLHVPPLGILIEAAEPVHKPDWLDERLEQIRAHTAKSRSDLFTNTQRWLTVRVEAVSVAPLADGKTIPDSALLEQKEDWGFEEVDLSAPDG